MRCCLVTLSREAFKPSQFSEAGVLTQRLFSLEKNLKAGKLNVTNIWFIFLLQKTMVTMLGRVQKYIQTCTRKNRQGMFSTKASLYWACFLMLIFPPKYSKFHIHFCFRILKYTSDNRSLEILHRSLLYYHTIYVWGSFWSKPYFSSAIGHRIKVIDLKEERVHVSTGSVAWNSFN